MKLQAILYIKELENRLSFHTQIDIMLKTVLNHSKNHPDFEKKSHDHC